MHEGPLVSFLLQRALLERKEEEEKANKQVKQEEAEFSWMSGSSSSAKRKRKKKRKKKNWRRSYSFKAPCGTQLDNGLFVSC